MKRDDAFEGFMEILGLSLEKINKAKNEVLRNGGDPSCIVIGHPNIKILDLDLFIKDDLPPNKAIVK
jgi:hypothetical protein